RLLPGDRAGFGADGGPGRPGRPDLPRPARQRYRRAGAPGRGTVVRLGQRRCARPYRAVVPGTGSWPYPPARPPAGALPTGRTAEVARVVAAAAERGPSVRLLCTARSAGRWSERVYRELGQRWPPAFVGRLDPVAPDEEDRVAMVAAAAEDLSVGLAALGEPP